MVSARLALLTDNLSTKSPSDLVCQKVKVKVKQIELYKPFNYIHYI